ncbi:sugar transporter [Schistosoma japonicum]|uniref:Sugar transporter n=1 Tax=Schistosoma japonicum TaxID=6182 RepID=A0A4Z2DH29_SCHJA|nr:sugar transporter [Schistosoma japonicum]
MTESILQYGNRISIYTNVCKALTNSVMNASSLCQHDNHRYNDSIVFTLIGATFYGICGKSNAVSLSVNSYIIENSTIDKRTHMLGLINQHYYGQLNYMLIT